MPALCSPASRAALLVATSLSSFGAHAAGTPRNVTEEIVITGKSIAVLNDIPTTTESATAGDLARTTNVVTPEDSLKYLPNILVRQRHIGDTQAPVTTRTSGVGASARSLIYVDGVLIPSLIGNNNTSASPKWGLVSPDAIERVDVLYGPFSAAYAGNSIGAVVAFTTRMPTALEASVEAQGAAQRFSKYGDDRGYGTWRVAANVGDAFDKASFRLSYNHLDNRGQPLTYATATVPAAAGTAGLPVTGNFNDANRTGAAIVVLGANGIEHQVQDNVSGRLTYEITPTISAGYTFGLFVNDDGSTVNSYLRDAGGQPVYSGALNIDGHAYTIAPSAFSNGVYRLGETQLAQGLSVSSHTGGVFDFEVVGTLFDYISSHQRVPSGALPAAFAGGAGATSDLDGTGWYTLDAKGTWKPFGESHVVTFGAHEDRFRLDNPKYALTDWIGGDDGALLTGSYGKTRTDALWLQDTWTVAPAVKATFGGRYEHWHAYDGANYSASPALDVSQPSLSADAFSPKLVVAYRPTPGWTFKGSVGMATRFPTVTELYQAVTTGVTLSVPNPDLAPERAVSSELSAEKAWATGDVRLSVFDERLRNALLSQTGPLPAGAATLAKYVQNVDRTHATGVELVVRQKDAFIPGLELSGWITYVDARIDKDAAFAAAVGKDIPQLPHLRGAFVATYTPTDDWAFTLAGRYSDRSFGTIENTDIYANTYQGFGAFFVMDVHARYRITPHLAADVGVNNINDRSYFLFHPFPQRTVVADLKYTY
jgi:iron complex outermembrane receptor protein